jgi:hypothetical protein
MSLTILVEGKKEHDREKKTVVYYALHKREKKEISRSKNKKKKCSVKSTHYMIPA